MWQESLVSESCRTTWRFRLMILGMYYTSNATKPWISAFKMKWLKKKTRVVPQHQNRKVFTYNLWLHNPDPCQMVALAIGRWKTQICLDIKVGISLPNFYEYNNQLTRLWTSKWNNSSKLRVVPQNQNQKMFTVTTIDLIIQIQIVVLLQISQMRGEK